MRKAGILLPVSSLPSDMGCGDFGENSRKFIDLIAACGFQVWQILPLNPLGYGNSPYQPYSSYAMDECYISLSQLKQEGLIASVDSYYEKSDRTDFEAVRKFKQPYLKEAFRNFKKDKEYARFVKISWVKRYGAFAALKKRNGGKEWSSWNDEEREWLKKPFKDDQLDQAIEFEMFIQYILKRQWNQLKKYANDRGIVIMGDMPFYVGYDSEDVWSSRDDFLLDERLNPTHVAGVPPDYFSETGQRWGNPIYDWNHLEKTDFDFWIRRIGYNAEVFDILRIDHFRAFDTYWKIPASCPTAVEGEWLEAPGYKLFDTLLQKLPHVRLVAEDLGELRPEVLKLRDHYHFKGMKIIQFTFEAFGGSFDDREQMIVYTGTHDNETIMGWFNSMSEDDKKKTLEFFKKHKLRHQKIHHAFIAYCMQSVAELAIVPMQDVLGLQNDARMNTPGTLGGNNWKWRMKDFEGLKKEKAFLKELIIKTERCKV